jgi:hypothetical protein
MKISINTPNKDCTGCNHLEIIDDIRWCHNRNQCKKISKILLKKTDSYLLLNNIRTKLNKKCFTTSDNNWVIKLEDVMKILSKHFN